MGEVSGKLTGTLGRIWVVHLEVLSGHFHEKAEDVFAADDDLGLDLGGAGCEGIFLRWREKILLHVQTKSI